MFSLSLLQEVTLCCTLEEHLKGPAELTSNIRKESCCLHESMKDLC